MVLLRVLVVLMGVLKDFMVCMVFCGIGFVYFVVLYWYIREEVQYPLKEVCFDGVFLVVIFGFLCIVFCVVVLV